MTLHGERSTVLLHADVEQSLNIQTLVKRPRAAVVASWQAAAREALADLEARAKDVEAKGSDASASALLTGHLTLFNSARSEFYSAIDPRIFSGTSLRIRQVVILIDDIFDMYLRLRKENQVLDEAVGVQHHLTRTWKALGNELPADFDADDHELLATEYRVRSLQFLISWRRAELVQAELLARQLGCRFVPLGVKHPAEVLFPLFDATEPPAPSVYVSHPISRPRRFQRDYGEWPPFVRQCNALPKALARLQVLPIMPTAVDELRLQQPKHEHLLVRLPHLDARWPGPDSEIGALVEPDFADYDQIFDLDSYQVAGDDHKLALAGLMRGLDASIQIEVPFRDHLLVAATQHVVIFRPLYETGEFSSGVEAEINHWRDLQRTDPIERRAAFIHDVRDVELALEKSSEGRRAELAKTGVIANSIYLISSELSERYDMSNTTDQCHAILHGEERAELLEELPISQGDLAGIRRSALAQATANFLYGQLIAVPVTTAGVGVFYVAADAPLTRELVQHVASFLRGDSPPPSPEMPRELGSARLAAWAAELLGLDLNG